MKREDIIKILREKENRAVKEKKAAMYKEIEERKRQFVRNMEEHYICIDDGQGGKIAIKKR